jgi:hypothetical protein
VQFLNAFVASYNDSRRKLQPRLMVSLSAHIEVLNGGSGERKRRLGATKEERSAAETG